MMPPGPSPSHSKGESPPIRARHGSTSTNAANDVEPSLRPSRYGASCVGCRRRKQKCDAQVPSCSRCLKLKEECVYESGGRSQLTAPLAPLLVKTYQFLRQIVSEDLDEPASSIRNRVRDYLDSSPLPAFVNTPDRAGRGDTPKREEGSQESLGEEDVTHTEVDELVMHMSLADDGENGHYGMTSLFWRPPSANIIERMQQRVSESNSEQRGLKGTLNEDIKSLWSERDRGTWEVWATDERGVAVEDDADILKANASMLNGWESLAYTKLELDSDAVTAQTIIHLLKVYFAWLYGPHCIVYRPVFIRDMALGGPYFSPFLLNAICALASVYADTHIGPVVSSRNGAFTPSPGQDFVSKAKLLLSSEMEGPSKVSSIQGLLLLAQRECVVGNLSQGWLYTGMVHAMMRDLGIHLDCSRLPIFGFGTLTAEDREIRRRLFWSTYTWDKVVSLALGRTPTFNAWQNVSPGPIVDDTEDNDLWQPYFLSEANEIHYDPQPSYMTLTARHFAKLCEIMCKIVMRLYDGRPQRVRNAPFVKRMRERLLSWFDELPEKIKLRADSLPMLCPPPHIFTINALYRAAWILLYRLFLPNSILVRLPSQTSLYQEASTTCTHMAEELHQLFQLYSKTFKLRNMNFILTWSMYSAATINAIDFQSEDAAMSAAASPRLGLSLHVLERGSLQSPGTKRSIEIIKHRLRTPFKRPEKRNRLDRERSHPDLAQITDMPFTSPLVQRNPPEFTTESVSSSATVDRPFHEPALSSASDQPFDFSTVFSDDRQPVHLPDLAPDQRMDLLQGMMAIPATGGQYNFPEWGPEWSGDWWKP